MLVELIILKGMLTVGIDIEVEMEVLFPPTIIWDYIGVVPWTPDEVEGSSDMFWILLKHLKRGLILSNDSLTVSIIQSERFFKGRFVESVLWSSSVLISNGEIL